MFNMLIGKALVTALAVAGLLGGAAAAQDKPSPTEFVAFRVDDRHVVAVVAETEDGGKEITTSGHGARYGFNFGDATPAAAADVYDATLAIKRWTVHLGAGRRANATSVRLVQGAPSCGGLVGYLLRIDDDSATTFAAVREKYYVVESRDASKPPPSRHPPAPPPVNRRQLETLLNEFLVRELPEVRQEAEVDIARRERFNPADEWARGRREVDAALLAGKAVLHYDVQAFQLAPQGPPQYFVRAEWRAGSRQAFGAAIWIRGGPTLSIITANLTPARWLRMPEFEGEVVRQNYGLILNVVDRDGDGWGEIIFAGGGYESMFVDVEEATPTGFERTGIGYGSGC